MAPFPEGEPSCESHPYDSEAFYEEIEANFRVWSFRVYYRRSFKSVHDHEMRFVKALLASCRPIRDKKAVIDWYENGVPMDEDTEEGE